MRPLLFLAAIFLPAALSAQTVYKWKDEKGQWVFSHNPSPAGKAAERVDMPGSTADAGAARNDNCAPFKVGEIRTNKESSSRGAAILVEDFQIKLLDQTATKTILSWSARLRNVGTAFEPLRVAVDLSDCQGFKLGGGERESTLDPRQTKTLSDTVTLTGTSAAAVGRFSLRLATSGTAAYTTAPSHAIATEAKAEVVVISHRIESNSEGFWLVGRVRNRGRVAARNVKLSYTLHESSGAQVPGGSFYLDGSELGPSAHIEFRQRLPQLHARSRVTASVAVESQ